MSISFATFFHVFFDLLNIGFDLRQIPGAEPSPERRYQRSRWRWHRRLDPAYSSATAVKVGAFMDGVQDPGAFHAARLVLPAMVEAGRGTIFLTGGPGRGAGKGGSLPPGWGKRGFLGVGPPLWGGRDTPCPLFAMARP